MHAGNNVINLGEYGESFYIILDGLEGVNIPDLK